jgi:hypothetical protein
MELKETKKVKTDRIIQPDSSCESRHVSMLPRAWCGKEEKVKIRKPRRRETGSNWRNAIHYDSALGLAASALNYIHYHFSTDH